MTRKDYELIARVFYHEVSTCKVLEEQTAIKRVASDLAIEFSKHHAAFDERKFMEACGFETANAWSIIVTKELKNV